MSLFHLGAFADPLVKQLRGLRFPADTVKHWQADADAITRLSIRRVLPPSHVIRARARLVDAINAELRKRKQP